MNDPPRSPGDDAGLVGEAGAEMSNGFSLPPFVAAWLPTRVAAEGDAEG